MSKARVEICENIVNEIFIPFFKAELKRAADTILYEMMHDMKKRLQEEAAQIATRVVLEVNRYSDKMNMTVDLRILDDGRETDTRT